ncbi:hypothetical protein [Archangium violaceum]|nr:hypothetical protein [Archangium violaceum]
MVSAIIITVLLLLCPVLAVLWVRAYMATRKLEERFKPVLGA